MGIFRILWKAVALVLALAVLLYLVALAINSRDAAPSADYLRLKAAVEARPPVDVADNAFVYLLGMAAPRGELPDVVGARRAAWLDAVNRDIGRLPADPLRAPIDFGAGRGADVKAMFEACGNNLDRRCREAFDAVTPMQAWGDTDRVLLDRYLELVTRPAWREIVPTEVSTPIAQYQYAVAGLRLRMLALRGADAETLHTALAQDGRYWRRVLGSSHMLISQMIAVSALRQHYYFGNLLLRKVDPAKALDAIPDEWRQELTRSELSFSRVMAGELVFQEGIARDPGGSDVFEEDGMSDRTAGRAVSRLRRAAVRPFFQPQDVLNHLAADYVAAEKAFDVPLADLPAAARAWSTRENADRFPSRIYDATGDYLRGFFSTDYGSYRLRVASLEGVRRVALVTTELRARRIVPVDVAAELARSSLRNPFGGAFQWSAADRAVVYVGPESHRWRRLACEY